MNGKTSLLSALAFTLVITVTAKAQEVAGTPGAPSATTTVEGKPIATTSATVRRQDRAQRSRIDPILADARSTAQGRAERLAHHDR
jgi:hypothetical protein